jgi:ADP-ribose pyrophosphatase YjhB (NUDIX family)
MDKTNFYAILVNAVIVKDGKILISQRSMKEKHQPGAWTIPGGKIENYDNKEEIFNIVEMTLEKEIKEEVGIEISRNVHLIMNNTFKHSKGHMVLALVFMCEYLAGEAQALEDTINVKWISSKEIDDFDFAPNVKEYLAKGFSLVPYLIRKRSNH